MRTWKLFAQTVPVVLILGLAAFPAPAAARQGPCAADIEKLCKDVPRGGAAIRQCLKEHQADLSDTCKARLLQQRERAGIKACRADAQKLCKDVQPGAGRIIQCLKEHEADLSPECKADLAQRAQRQARRPAGSVN
jgi:Cysteine rich repeat